jgi:hypothetical protein
MLYLKTTSIIQPPTTIAGQAESKLSTSVLHIFNHHPYPKELKKSLC